LSLAAEDELAGHVRTLSSVGISCTRRDVKQLAYEFAIKNGANGFFCEERTAGYYWFRGFLSHHSDLNVKKADYLSVPRAMAMNKQQVVDFFFVFLSLSYCLPVCGEIKLYIYTSLRTWQNS